MHPPLESAPPACARARQRMPEPQHAPEPASAHQAPAHAGTPDARQNPSAPEPPAHQSPPARQSPQRARQGENLAGSLPAMFWRVEPQRAPGRKPGSRALTEPSIGLRNASRAEQRVPAAKNRQLCPAAVKIDDSSQPQDQNTRLFALSESPYANNRQNRPFPTSETAKNRLF